MTTPVPTRLIRWEQLSSTFGKCEMEVAATVLTNRAVARGHWNVAATIADLTGDDQWGFRMLRELGWLTAEWRVMPAMAERVMERLSYTDEAWRQHCRRR